MLFFLENVNSFKFEPFEFINNLKYMGLGMLGIFIVIIVIALITVLLNKIFKPKQ